MKFELFLLFSKCSKKYFFIGVPVFEWRERTKEKCLQKAVYFSKQRLNWISKTRRARVVCQLAKLCCLSTKATDNLARTQRPLNTLNIFIVLIYLSCKNYIWKKKYRLVWYCSPEKFVRRYGRSLRLKTTLKIRHYRFIVKILKYVLEKNRVYFPKDFWNGKFHLSLYWKNFVKYTVKDFFVCDDVSIFY